MDVFHRLTRFRFRDFRSSGKVRTHLSVNSSASPVLSGALEQMDLPFAFGQGNSAAQRYRKSLMNTVIFDLRIEISGAVTLIFC